MARKKLRISGIVGYVNEKNQRLAIPTGYHEFAPDAGAGGTIYWRDNAGAEHARPNTLLEYAQYKKNKNLVELRIDATACVWCAYPGRQHVRSQGRSRLRLLAT